MMKTFLAASVALSLVGCIKQEEAPDELRTALPTHEQVRIKLPEAGRTIGQLADYYVVTRNVTRTFNGGSAWVLILLHAIVQYPVTSVDKNVYTWGPWSDALDPAEYKLEVTDNGDGTYDYDLSGRSKTAANSAFEVVITGHSDPRAGKLQGNGVFNIDFDAGRRINPIDAGDDRGEVTVTYDLAKKHLDLDIIGVDDQGKPITAEYAYDEDATGGGAMTFSAKGDAGGGSQMESFQVTSKWASTGQGRSDATATGGDIQATVTVSLTECWDTSFKRTFYMDSHNFAPAEGAVASCLAK
jgi:hypothetical protein